MKVSYPRVVWVGFALAVIALALYQQTNADFIIDSRARPTKTAPEEQNQGEVPQVRRCEDPWGLVASSASVALDISATRCSRLG